MQFFSLVTAREDVGGAIARLGLPRNLPDELVEGDERLSAPGRIGIYNDMYFVRLRDGLREDFPALARVMGAQQFDTLTADYLEAHPPRDHSLRDLGRELPGFLRVGRWSAAAWHADLAALEWARADLFDRADSAPLLWDDLRAMPPEGFAELPVVLVPAARVVVLDHVVDEVWRRHHAAEESTEPEGEGVNEAPVTRRTALVLWREGTLICQRRLTDDEVAVADDLARGARFGELCERLGEGRSEPEAAQVAFQLLAWLTQVGALQAVPPVAAEATP